MPRSGHCRCGFLLKVRRGPDGYKTRCPQCGAVVRLASAFKAWCTACGVGLERGGDSLPLCDRCARNAGVLPDLPPLPPLPPPGGEENPLVIEMEPWQGSVPRQGSPALRIGIVAGAVAVSVVLVGLLVWLCRR